jgi:hypothetical protein
MKLRIVTNYIDVKFVYIDVIQLYCLIASRDIVVKSINDGFELEYICTAEMLTTD